ncbi:MAG: hypothetical protein AMXMBFR26_04020 [Porticoccaceae bacterium]
MQGTVTAGQIQGLVGAALQPGAPAPLEAGREQHLQIGAAMPGTPPRSGRKPTHCAALTFAPATLVVPDIRGYFSLRWL